MLFGISKLTMGLFRYYPSNPKRLDMELEKRILIHSVLIPALFVAVFWIVEIIEQTTGVSFVQLGVYPLHLKGLPGILFSPFIHSGFNHLISNSIPFFILFTALIYFYRRISYRIFFQMYFLAGLCIWLAGREAWHIGASGVVYALAAFHLVSGIIRSDVRLLTLSAIVVFLYGGLIWGMFPIRPEVSWEGHLWGAISGVAMAFFYRKYILRRDKFDWEDEEDEESSSELSTFPEEIKEEESDSEQSQYSEEKEEDLREQMKYNVLPKPDNMNHTGQY